MCVRFGPSAVIGARRSPSAKFHLSWPVSGLVNLRIWPSHAIDAHSGVFQIPDLQNDYFGGIYLPLRGQHTFSVSRLTLLHCNKAPRHRDSNLCEYWGRGFVPFLGQKSLQY